MCNITYYIYITTYFFITFVICKPTEGTKQGKRSTKRPRKRKSEAQNAVCKHSEERQSLVCKHTVAQRRGGMQAHGAQWRKHRVSSVAMPLRLRSIKHGSVWARRRGGGLGAAFRRSGRSVAAIRHHSLVAGRWSSRGIGKRQGKWQGGGGYRQARHTGATYRRMHMHI